HLGECAARRSTTASAGLEETANRPRASGDSIQPRLLGCRLRKCNFTLGHHRGGGCQARTGCLEEVSSIHAPILIGTAYPRAVMSRRRIWLSAVALVAVMAT